MFSLPVIVVSGEMRKIDHLSSLRFVKLFDSWMAAVAATVSLCVFVMGDCLYALPFL